MSFRSTEHRKSCELLMFSYAYLIDLIKDYNVYFLNTNNKFRLLCNFDYLNLVWDICISDERNYDYDYYRFFIEKDIKTIKELISNNQLFKVV